MAQVFPQYLGVSGQVDTFFTVDPLGQQVVRSPVSLPHRGPVPFLRGKGRAEREISPLRIWVCSPAPVFVYLSVRPSFRGDLLIHHRIREVEPQRHVLHSSRNNSAYLKVVRGISPSLHPGEPTGWDGRKRPGFGARPIWFRVIPAMSSMDCEQSFKLFDIF